MKSGGWSAPRYEPAQERAWHLSTLINETQCAWCAHDIASGEPMALHWSEGHDALDSDALPAQPASATFVTLPEWSALVPEAALAPGAEAQHLRLVHGGLPTGAMRTETVDTLGAVCVYLHDDELERKVLDRFPNARPLPMQSLLARGAMSRSADGPVLLVHRGQDRLDCAIADHGRLLLSNTYPARSSQDALYYALLSADGASLRPGELRLLFGGTHLTPHEIDLLQRYFSQSGASLHAWNGHADEPGRMPQRWFALLEQFACAS